MSNIDIFFESATSITHANPKTTLISVSDPHHTRTGAVAMEPVPLEIFAPMFGTFLAQFIQDISRAGAVGGGEVPFLQGLPRARCAA